VHAMMSANVQNGYFEFWVIRKCVCNEGKCLEWVMLNLWFWSWVCKLLSLKIVLSTLTENCRKGG
jgi:hypothetical protein